MQKKILRIHFHAALSHCEYIRHILNAGVNTRAQWYKDIAHSTPCRVNAIRTFRQMINASVNNRARVYDIAMNVAFTPYMIAGCVNITRLTPLPAWHFYMRAAQ